MTQQEKILSQRDCWKTVAFQPMVEWANLYGVSQTDRGTGCNILFYYVLPCPGFITQELLGTHISLEIDGRFYSRYERVTGDWEDAEKGYASLTRIVPAVIASDASVYNGQLEPASTYDENCLAPGYRQYITTLPEQSVQQYISDESGKEDFASMLIPEMDAYEKWLAVRVLNDAVGDDS